MSQECGVPKGVWFQTMLFAGVNHSPWFLSQQVLVLNPLKLQLGALPGCSLLVRDGVSTGDTTHPLDWPFSPSPEEPKMNSVLAGPSPHSRLRISPFPQKSDFSQLSWLLSWSEHCLSSVTQTQGYTETVIPHLMNLYNLATTIRAINWN